MQIAIQISYGFQPAIGAAIGALVTLLVTGLITTLLSNRLSKRQAARRERAAQSVSQIRSQIFATKEAYQGKYMPGVLRALLDQAWTRSVAMNRYFGCSGEADIEEIEAQAAEAIVSIKRLAATPPTTFDLEADRLALVQELAEIEENNLQQVEALNQELAEFEENNRHQVESAYQAQASERTRIAEALEQIEQLKRKGVEHEETTDHLLFE
mgnify:CR=1 FL=1